MYKIFLISLLVSAKSEIGSQAVVLKYGHKIVKYRVTEREYICAVFVQ